MKVVMSLLVALYAVAAPTLVQAEDWPTRSVRLIVPYPAGGNADVIARIVAQGLQEILHQPFVVENKAGAGGVIGANAVIHSAPDGGGLGNCRSISPMSCRLPLRSHTALRLPLSSISTPTTDTSTPRT